MKWLSKKLLYIFAAIIVIVVAGYVIWQKYKYKIVNRSIEHTVARQTDSLYVIRYDSLRFDEVAGSASIKNIRIIPDTARLSKMPSSEVPDILLDVRIRSISINGVKTLKALQGDKIEGDSVIIDHPDITLYSIKPLQKSTLIQSEANLLYRQLLGNLSRIKIGFVLVNGVNARGVNYFSKDKNFDFDNGNFVLQDILIDSAHHLDTNRVLFCKQAAFTVDSFFSYNNNRQEMAVKNVHFLGKQKKLVLDKIIVNRFASDTSSPIRLIGADQLIFKGLNSNEIVENKNLKIDSILCNAISLYQFPAENLKTGTKNVKANADSSGFMNVYSVALQHLHFPKVKFIPFAESNYSLGNISITVNNVATSRLVNLQLHPMDYTKEVAVSLDRFSLQSKDKNYRFSFQNILINSLKKNLLIHSFNIAPFAGEKEFANHFKFQKDRYQLALKDISLDNIDMNALLDKRLKASDLLINSANVVISRDLHKPLEQKSKVGNYPSQLLLKLKTPVEIAKATINNAHIEYRENQKVSGRVGVVTFDDSKLQISNVTNIPEIFQQNGNLNIAFDSRILGQIPINGNFNFLLKSNNGDFVVNGHVGAFDAKLFNKISIPMALVKITAGKINSIDFHLNGNNTSAKGDFLMKYDDLKVDVMKHDGNSKTIRKKGFASFAANLLITNSNPTSSGIRKEKPEYDRDIYKSFFNLVWKTVFTGMKQTVGIP